MNETVFAQQSGQADPEIVLFRVSESVLTDPEADAWSQPVQFRFHKLDDGTYDLVLRTVDIGTPFDV